MTRRFIIQLNDEKKDNAELIRILEEAKANLSVIDYIRKASKIYELSLKKDKA